MSTQISNLPRSAVTGFAVVVAAMLVWRVLVTGVDAVSERRTATRGDAASSPSASASSDERWRRRLARNPADGTALSMLALEFERQGKRDEAGAAMKEALRLAPADPQTLLQAASYFLRVGDDAQALSSLRRAADASAGNVNVIVWQIFLAALDTGRHRDFFDAIARDNPPWWPGFFRQVCEHAVNIAALQAVFAVRVEAANATADERRCLIERLQRNGLWTGAHQLWLNGLPVEQRQRVGHIFNGDFELPLTDLGFDWRVVAQDAVIVATEPSEGMTGKHALSINFVNTRYLAPPVYQYLMLHPGRYVLEGRGRTDLESRLGLQWGLYCQDASGQEPRELARSGRFGGAEDWRSFRQDFAVPTDCPVQLLRVELANPKRDSPVSGAVAARLIGRVWFDDLRVRVLD